MSRRVLSKISRRENFPSLRLTFTYEASNIRLVSKQSVEIASQPTDPLEPEEGTTGFWYEVRDEEGLTIYRRIIQNPIKFAAEVKSDDPDRPFAWEEVRDPRGSFFLLIPDLKDARSLILVSSPLKFGAPLEPAEELARFDLMKAPQGEGEE